MNNKFWKFSVLVLVASLLVACGPQPVNNPMDSLVLEVFEDQKVLQSWPTLVNSEVQMTIWTNGMWVVENTSIVDIFQQAGVFDENIEVDVFIATCLEAPSGAVGYTRIFCPYSEHMLLRTEEDGSWVEAPALKEDFIAEFLPDYNPEDWHPIEGVLISTQHPNGRWSDWKFQEKEIEENNDSESSPGLIARGTAIFKKPSK